MRGDPENYKVAHNIVTILDIILALMIIFFAYRIIGTTFGAAALSFGLAMIVITTILKIVQKW